MYLRQLNSNGRIYLSIVKGNRDKDGKAKSKNNALGAAIPSKYFHYDLGIAKFLTTERLAERLRQTQLVSLNYWFETGFQIQITT